ncbi:PREDICTED: melanoma-associated antigen 10-like [Bison bison bison]|uniref:Melanoma-associated antigen 10-like n=1 Tax=Bison bison bison TaxID=43346 RepID=A0A6P3IHP7_BISBB|nr:PREDICTED: melanoma-associated antigen 10-like [Bison bison bison]
MEGEVSQRNPPLPSALVSCPVGHEPVAAYADFFIRVSEKPAPALCCVAASGGQRRKPSTFVDYEVIMPPPPKRLCYMKCWSCMLMENFQSQSEKWGLRSAEVPEYQESGSTKRKRPSTSQAQPDGGYLLRDAIDDKVRDLLKFLLLRYHRKEVATKAEMLSVIKDYQDLFPCPVGHEPVAAYADFFIRVSEKPAPALWCPVLSCGGRHEPVAAYADFFIRVSEKPARALCCALVSCAGRHEPVAAYADFLIQVLEKPAPALCCVDPTGLVYVLVNTLGLTYNDSLRGDEESMPMAGLLVNTLSIIFIDGNCTSEEKIWEMLGIMGLYAGMNHSIYGDPRELLTQVWVQQGYLEYRQVPNSDPACYEFLWGPRTYAETTKMKVLEFLAKVHDTTPSAFPSLYEEALQSEKTGPQATVVARAKARARARARARDGTCARTRVYSRATSNSFSCPN